MASGSNPKVSSAPISSVKITPNYYHPYQPIFPFVRPQIPSSVTSDGMVSQETPTPKPRSRKHKSDKKDQSVPVVKRSPSNPQRSLAQTKEAMEKQCVTNMIGGSSTKKKSKEKAPLLEPDSEEENTGSEESMDLSGFDTTGISKEEMELWSQCAPENQQLVKTLKREGTLIQQSSCRIDPSVPNSTKRSHMSRMEKYMRDHPFFAQQSVFNFTTTQRRAFERDVYDHARGLSYSKANAKKQVVAARRLCGEKDYDSDDSRLGGFREVDDSTAALMRIPGQATNQISANLAEYLTKKRRLEPTEHDISEGDRPSKRVRKGKSINDSETTNQTPTSTSLPLTRKNPETIPIKDLPIRVIVPVITAMVEIIEGHIECDCQGLDSVDGEPKEVDLKPWEKINIMDSILTKKRWPKFRKGLLRPFDFQRLRDDRHLHKAFMDLIQNKKNVKTKLMMAWRVAQSHGARIRGARNKFERSFYDIISGPDDFDELLRLAGLNPIDNQGPAEKGDLKDIGDAVQAQQSTGVAEVSHALPAEESKKRRKRGLRKAKKPLDNNISPKREALIDPLNDLWNSIGPHEAQQASLTKMNTRSSTSALAGLLQNDSNENEEALIEADRAITRAGRAERKERQREKQERDRLKLEKANAKASNPKNGLFREASANAGDPKHEIVKKASANTGDPKIEIISHNQEDDFSDIAGIIDGLHSASLQQKEPQDVTAKPSEPTIRQEHPRNEQSANAAVQCNLDPKPREIIEISSDSASPPPEQPKKWTKDQKHKALQADSWLMYTGESAGDFPDRLEAAFQDLKRKKGLRFTHGEQLRIQDMLQANYGISYEGNDFQDRILDRIATIQSREEVIQYREEVGFSISNDSVSVTAADEGLSSSDAETAIETNDEEMNEESMTSDTTDSEAEKSSMAEMTTTAEPARIEPRRELTTEAFTTTKPARVDPQRDLTNDETRTTELSRLEPPRSSTTEESDRPTTPAPKYSTTDIDIQFPFSDSPLSSAPSSPILPPSPLLPTNPLSTPPPTPTPTPSPRKTPKTKSTRKLLPPKISPYFPTPPKPPRPKRPPVSIIPFPPLSSPRFGLIQETLSHDAFALLLATIFLNQTRGSVAIPVFYHLLSLYPTPASLAEARYENIVAIFSTLGLQNQRARKVIGLARQWVERPPVRGVKVRKVGYLRRGDGGDGKEGEGVGDGEGDGKNGEEGCVDGWEIGGFMGVGAYAIDSWRIFCRDELLGRPHGLPSWSDLYPAQDQGENQPPDDQKEEESGESTPTKKPKEPPTTNHPPRSSVYKEELQKEWTRVLPQDKELRAYLRWRWLRMGFVWDPITGQRTAASREVMREAEKGGVVVEEGGDVKCEWSQDGVI